MTKKSPLESLATHPSLKQRAVCFTTMDWNNLLLLDQHQKVQLLHQECSNKTQNKVCRIRNESDILNQKTFKIPIISLGLSIICFQSSMPLKLSAADLLLTLSISSLY